MPILYIKINFKYSAEIILTRQFLFFRGAEVVVQNETRQRSNAKITGIDNYGYLEAQLESGGIITLQPDGNSFNMMEGLIYTKVT